MATKDLTATDFATVRIGRTDHLGIRATVWLRAG